MAGDATPPSSPPPPAPELPPGLLAEYLESARAQLGVLAGLAERLLVAGGGPPPRPAPRPPTQAPQRQAYQRPAAPPARIVPPPPPPPPQPPLPEKPAERTSNGPPVVPPPAPAPPPKRAEPVVAPADAVLVPEVIYVEDDAALAELLEYGLHAQGYRFLAYRNGRSEERRVGKE